MLSNILRHPFVLLLTFFILIFAFFNFGPRLPLSIISQSQGEPLIVTGEGTGVAVPDTAVVSLGVESSGQTLAQAQEDVNRKSKTLTDELKKLGVGEKDIKTTNYSVFPEYDFGPGPQRVRGYRVSINYTVKIKEIGKVNEILVAATGAGANQVGGINFEVNEETREKLLSEARAEAVTNARKKAEGLARAAGVTLGRVINISEAEGFEPPTPIALRELAPDSEVGPTKPVIEPGESKIKVSVSVSFEIR